MIHIYWYLGRSAGFVSYWLLFTSVALGLLTSSRRSASVVSPGWVPDLHEFLSLVVLAMSLFHALVMLPDPYAGFTLRELLVPMQSHLDPVATSLGIVTLYAAALITGSFYVRRLIGQRTWRLLHFLTFGVFVMATTHGLLLGTDSGSILATASYALCCGAVVLLTLFRLTARRRAQVSRRVSQAS